jgi:hypothetical protein
MNVIENVFTRVSGLHLILIQRYGRASLRFSLQRKTKRKRKKKNRSQLVISYTNGNSQIKKVLPTQWAQLYYIYCLSKRSRKLFYLYYRPMAYLFLRVILLVR